MKHFALAEELLTNFHPLFNRDCSSLGVVLGRNGICRNKTVVVNSMRRTRSNGTDSNVLHQPPLDLLLFSYLWRDPVDVNLRCGDGDGPVLHWALEFRPSIFKIIMESHCDNFKDKLDVNLQNSHGSAAIHR